MDRRYRIKIYTLSMLFLLLGITVGLITGAYYGRICKENNTYGGEIHLKGYKFISPLVDYENPRELRNKDTQSIKRKIEEMINDKTKEGEVIYVSVYFRDLLNGPWFGIGEDEKFEPASLMKVPLMIACLKYAQQDPAMLNYKLKHEKEINDDVKQNILPDKKIKAGEFYSIDELIYRMIVYSDNAAKNIILTHMDQQLIESVYNDLGAGEELMEGKTNSISAKEYASFFRVLFNASYLNREMSEKALKILSDCRFDIGIRAGVPSGVTVANKYGERGTEVNNTFQLHDCGIIYHKYRPYLLCVMTYGTDFLKEVDIIKEISTIVYQEVDKCYTKQVNP